MLRNRVIPVLLVKGRGLVKTVKFKDPKYVGDPINAIRIFNEKEVDELLVVDIQAGSRGSGPNFDLVQDIAGECFMPLAYGGGVSSAEHARRLFSLGVEKVVVRSAAATDMDILTRVADVAGSQAVSFSIDIRRGRLGKYRVHAPGTPRDGDSDWLGAIEAAMAAGAGEVVLNSVDRDGTMAGMDLNLVSVAAGCARVPLVVVGGVGSLGDITSATEAGADAVGVGSFFVFHGPRRAVLITYPTYSELTKLLGGKGGDV